MSDPNLARALDTILASGIDSPTPEQWRQAIKTAPSAPFTQSDAPLSGYIPQALQAIAERLNATLSQDKGHTAMRTETYYSVLLRYAYPIPSQWHPVDRTGPFAVLTRGAFSTEKLAHDWALDQLNGAPYEIKQFSYDIED